MVNLLVVVLLAQTTPATNVPLICIDAWRGDASLRSSAEDALSAALLATGKFRVTEKCQKAAFVVKGSVSERSDLKSRSEAEAASAGSAGVAVSAAGAIGAVASSIGSGESLASSETKRQVTLTVKVVDADGEVILATTQDSAPSKNKSALSEAADKLARHISRKLFPEAPAAQSQSKSGYVKLK